VIQPVSRPPGLMYDAPAYTYDAPQRVHKFTGKERDAESGLDYFGARHYASGLGRFMIPDWAAKPTAVPYAHYGNPQSLNLYSYVQNNPTTVGDPDGHGPLDFLAGAANAFGTDFFGGAGRQESANGDYQLGQTLGDAWAAYSGLEEAEAGVGGNLLSIPFDEVGIGELGHVVSTAAVIQGSTAVVTGGAHVVMKVVSLSQRDPKRFFTPNEKQQLKDNADGKCETCGKKTTQAQKSQAGQKPSSREGQAGHKKAWSKGGKTKLKNGKWQCRKCNLSEGANSR
jgi:RHS repeat-associated protein